MLDKKTERLLQRMDRMGFAGAGEALREIERLHGLLREGIGDIWIKNADGSFTCMYEAIAAWHKRVRETLGDKP